MAAPTPAGGILPGQAPVPVQGTYDPLFAAVIAKAPPPNTTWPLRQKHNWFRALAAVANIVWPSDSHAIEVSATPTDATGAPVSSAPAPTDDDDDDTTPAATAPPTNGTATATTTDPTLSS